MGKLHTLRRAIERDPEPWCMDRGVTWTGVPWTRISIKGARKYKGEWVPTNWPWRPPYAAFVKHVLSGLGIADVGPE